MRIHVPDLQRCLERYLLFGGLPAAVAEASQGASRPGESTKRIMRDSLLREIRRKGATTPAANALLERMMRVNRQKATAPMRALPDSPSFVATRDELEFSPTANLIPAALALWALSG